jgi:hypothetical protein
MNAKGLVVLLVGAGLTAAYADERLHPLRDKNPLKLRTSVGELQISEAVPGPELPVTAMLKPRKGHWDCSEKLWLLVDVENKGEKSVLARAEISSVKKKGWGVNKGAVHVPAGETRTLPVLIMRGMVEGRDEDKLRGLFNDMRGYPGGHQQTGWRQLDASAVNRVKLELFTDAARVECEVSDLRAVTRFHLPSDSELQGKYVPTMDEFGQNRNTDWKFKIKSEADFASQLKSEIAWLEKFAVLESRSRFGGWTGGHRFEPTGHFQSVKKDGIWWLADPEGWPFWSIGATGFNLGLGKTKTPGIGSWNPRQKNLKLKYGSDWEKDYTTFTHRRLKAWGMNTLGNWSSADFYTGGGTPYTVAVHFKRPSIHEPNPKAHSRLPDVFHPNYRKNTFAAVSRFKKETVDPWCIGFFIDNELPFHQANSPAHKALLSPKECASRQEFIRRLKEKYGTLEKLNAAWNSSFADWNSLKPGDGKSGPGRVADMLEFSEAWFDRYYETCRDAMREHAPDKLYLGSRINHWSNHAALNASAKYCDVVSINLYDYTPDVFRAPDGFDAPVMIGEFHFGTITERGVWGGGLCTAMDMEHAVELFQGYTAEAVKNPLIVGAHWFKFSDQPLTGRKDGENYRIGFVDVADTPYVEMVKACRAVAEAMYPMRAGINK